MHSRLFVWGNCIVVISVTPELGDATWQTSSTALRCPPRIYIFITMQERKRHSIIPAHSECPEPERFNWMYSNVIHWTITLSFCEPPVQSFCLCWGLLPFPCPLPNTPTPFKLEIGLAFVGDTKGESIDALITAIHYPNKHGTQPLLDTNSGYVKCLARDKALDAGINPCCINPRAQTPLSARASPGSVQAGINPHAQAMTYVYRIQTRSCDRRPAPLCWGGILSFFLPLSHVGPRYSKLTGPAHAPQLPCTFRVSYMDGRRDSWRLLAEDKRKGHSSPSLSSLWRVPICELYLQRWP